MRLTAHSVTVIPPDSVSYEVSYKLCGKKWIESGTFYTLTDAVAQATAEYNKHTEQTAWLDVRILRRAHYKQVTQ